MIINKTPLVLGISVWGEILHYTWNACSDGG